ncbi:helix-turn-helix domain-containing protein [Rouxiella chamberiensis]|uniref:XRE family transcriptional regulator n=1 Tax=Rouxiella chamberiensis TaxID=1513468 RepID=A0ABY7HT76_9GAMM|nr:XRE family transcriptional regulator [Rouxiella chamberiensis]WAT02615.1 XRE family transcriptional regulator [Rouxiella chamberiensis]
MTRSNLKPVEPDISSLEADIGLRLKKMRKARNLTISELAAQAGVSAGTISQIERNLTNPTIRMLEQLRQVFNVPLTYFLEGEEAATPGIEHFIRRENDRPHFHVGTSGIAKSLLSPPGDYDVKFMIIDVPAGARSEQMLVGEGEKAGLLLSGELTLEIEDEKSVLYPGDSFQFKSHLLHNVFNHTSLESQVLWVMLVQTDKHL